MLLPKLVGEKLVANHEIVDKIIIGRCGLIRCTPAAIHNNKLPTLDELFNGIFLRLSQFFEPLLKIFHLCIGEGLFRIALKLYHHRVKDILN